MTLRACSRCGGTLTDVFRFCPACGHSSDGDFGWPLEGETQVSFPVEPEVPVSFPVVERQRRPRPRRAPRRTWRDRVAPAAGVRLPAFAPAARALWQRIPAVPRPSVGPVVVRARRLAAAFGGAIGLLLEVVLVTAGSARDALRSMVLLRKLHAQRAAVIYSTGCAALSGDARRIQHAQAELRMLDDLITAAAGHTRLAFTSDASAATAADAPTEETVRR